jgi:hypothetical protein
MHKQYLFILVMRLGTYNLRKPFIILILLTLIANFTNEVMPVFYHLQHATGGVQIPESVIANALRAIESQ